MKSKQCAYCGENLTKNFLTDYPEGLFCSWDCYELWEEQEKKIAEQDFLKDRYSEGELKLKK